VNKPEMKVKEFEIYNAIYCGLCREMGKSYGMLSKFCLSYDMTFVSLLCAALTEGCDGYERKKCRVNPLKKCTYCKNDRETQSLAAAAGVVLTDMKVLDNIEDSGFFKSLFCRFLRVFTKRWSKKAYKKYPELKNIVEDYVLGQREAENDPECGLDKAAEPTARAVSRILKLIPTDEKYKFVLERMGYCLGKWVYLCDVADDLVKDIKKHNFNPLIKDIPKDAEPLKFAEQRLTPILNTCFSECATYSELLEIKKYKPILDNILYEGLKERQKLIFQKENCK
jgi:hypothetical protein